MERQYTGWGYIDWLHSEKIEQEGAMRVGIVSINSHAHMPAHMHFDEQIIYTFQGCGYSLINGERIPMSASENNLLHWMPGVIHEMVNIEDQPYVHLMVTCSDQFISDNFQDYKEEKEKMSFQERFRCLYDTVDIVRETFLKKLRYSFVIYDLLGNVVTTSRAFPKYCYDFCKETAKKGNAYCMKKKDFPLLDMEGSFECPGGLTVLTVPIVYRDHVIGYVEGGYVYITPKKNDLSNKSNTETGYLENEQNLYLAPISSVENSRKMLNRIAAMIRHFCEIQQHQKELEEQEKKLRSERKNRELLEANLKHIEGSVINLKINNHFLFNTLNQMAAMALEGGGILLYRSIVNLSKLFQYTLRQEGDYVSFNKELDYVKSYLQLQNLRYEEHLMLEYEINVDPEQWMVPFNWLMPLVENAFIHGMKEVKEKRIWIHASEEEGWLHVLLGNNGKQMEETQLRALRIRMRGNTSHGMSMVYQKLQNCYGDQFVMDIRSSEKGTEVITMFPSVKNWHKEDL